jgi:fumarate hydratase class II
LAAAGHKPIAWQAWFRVTALTSRIGYDLGGEIEDAALERGCPVIDVARELSGLQGEALRRLLEPGRLADPHGAA